MWCNSFTFASSSCAFTCVTWLFTFAFSSAYSYVWCDSFTYASSCCTFICVTWLIQICLFGLHIHTCDITHSDSPLRAGDTSLSLHLPLRAHIHMCDMTHSRSPFRAAHSYVRCDGFTYVSLCCIFKRFVLHIQTCVSCAKYSKVCLSCYIFKDWDDWITFDSMCCIFTCVRARRMRSCAISCAELRSLQCVTVCAWSDAPGSDHWPWALCLHQTSWVVAHSYVWHDSFICVTWLIHMFEKNRSSAHQMQAKSSDHCRSLLQKSPIKETFLGALDAGKELRSLQVSFAKEPYKRDVPRRTRCRQKALRLHQTPWVGNLWVVSYGRQPIGQ